MNDEEQWLEIPAGILHLEGVIWVREPAETSLMDILQNFREGTYDKPFVHDDGHVRRLHFDFESTQSEMIIDDEYALTFAYTRKMMAFLLFNPHPAHVVIVGLGGGSLTKFCYQHLPRSRVTTLEIDERVIGLSPMFNIPPSDKRKRILHVDAAEYFRTGDEPADVVLIDGCDSDGTADIFCEPEFYEDLHRQLAPGGIVVVNLVGAKKRSRALKRTIENCFGSPPLALNLDEEKNQVLFAFNEPGKLHDWRQIKRQAEELAQQYGLDFPYFSRKLQSAWPH